MNKRSKRIRATAIDTQDYDDDDGCGAADDKKNDQTMMTLKNEMISSGINKSFLVLDSFLKHLMKHSQIKMQNRIFI